MYSFGAIKDFKGNSITDCPFRYQGQYEDSETGLYYNRFRYYSPEEGMYISQDPIRLNGGDRLYGYVGDVNCLVDRFGLNPGDPGGVKLREHLRQSEKYGKGGTKTLNNGRIRYYDELKMPRTQGEMKGMRPVREWDPATGKKRTWMETVDHNNRVRQVRPQESITNGEKLHYRFDKDGNYVGTKEGKTRRDIKTSC